MREVMRTEYLPPHGRALACAREALRRQCLAVRSRLEPAALPLPRRAGDVPRTPGTTRTRGPPLSGQAQEEVTVRIFEETSEETAER